ncbi:LacI family DNA-binding transcriptional regulator [Gracilibacillus sp. YIM 98692]|uniref:GntR family transcriptional regulator n=1 Tax=Gracilibacillus sp. YIM 98692 TaxID=2663532 RepID=UPI0013D7A393|nr:LacI family DNA-binding transcriptional regulator [Gracilibacillus sp. YIM 98692]
MKSLYEQVYETLKKEITSGKHKVGDRIPSEKKLSETFEVSRITSKKALEKLMHEGYVYRQRGKGTFVSDFQNEKNANKNSVKKKTPLFGLIVTSLGDDAFGSGFVNSIIEESSGKSLIILKSSLGVPEREEQIVKELLDYGVDGIIVSPAQGEHYGSEILKMVVNKFPLVLIDRTFKGIAATSVSTDNQEAAKKGVNFLFELGHEDIGVMMPTNYGATTIENRLSGIVSAFAEKQVKVNRDLWCSEIKSTLPIPQATPEEDIEIIKQHIRDNPEMTAIFALEYAIALLVKNAVEQLGMDVPKDISILCFDSPSRTDVVCNFTYIKQNEEELGKTALQRLLGMYQGEAAIKKDRIPAELIIGNTTKAI